MDIVVTGAIGEAGSWTVDHLADAGHEVLGIDLRRPPGEREHVAFRPADVTNHGAVLDLVLDFDPDAVVHFAGLRSDRGPGQTIFTTNVTGTYNVLDAAGRASADVIWASSEAVYGRLRSDNPLDWLPIDESHPTRPRRPYGTSKLLGEQAGAALARRYGIAVVSMRATAIRYPGEYKRGPNDVGDDVELASTGNLWSYVDIRDVLSFIDAALAAQLSGHEAFNVAAVDNRAGVATSRIVEAVYETLPDRYDIDGDASVFATTKAADRLGWHPRHQWRDASETESTRPEFLD